jgi:low temperature requirement protein LtrA
LNDRVPEEPAEGKRVSWVELYFDLIFVFAVSQTAGVMEADSHGGVGRAITLFIPLWWTWIGYAIFYNRHHEDRAIQRLLVLAGTLPCAVAAIEVHSAARGHAEAFALALAGARLVLAAAFTFAARHSRQVAAGYAVSTAAFCLLAFLPSPWRYVVLSLALIQEAGFLLLRNGEPHDRGAEPGAERPHRSRASLRDRFKPPADPSRRLDAAHLAERFGLMMIILLGEVVISVGESAVELTRHDARYWVTLVAALVLAAALWWIYFTAAAPIAETVLRASGGNPSMAYGLYAVGHLPAVFALLTMAAGISRALSGEPSPSAAWYVTGGLAVYVMSSRIVDSSGLRRFGPWPNLALGGVTACVALLEPVISITGVAAVAYVTWSAPGRLKGIESDPLSYFRPAPQGAQGAERVSGPENPPAAG